MALVISHRIREQEFDGPISPEELSVLRRAARTALAAPLAAKGLPPGTRLLKAYGTSAQGPRRIVFLLAVADQDLFLLFYRDKNDKVGANITPKNPVFARQLEKHLSLLLEDIQANRFDVIPVH